MYFFLFFLCISVHFSNAYNSFIDFFISCCWLLFCFIVVVFNSQSGFVPDLEYFLTLFCDQLEILPILEVRSRFFCATTTTTTTIIINSKKNYQHLHSEIVLFSLETNSNWKSRTPRTNFHISGPNYHTSFFISLLNYWQEDTDWRICDLIQFFWLRRLSKTHLCNFDEKNPAHMNLLQRLWCASFPNKPFQGVVSEQWKDIGFQVRGILKKFQWNFVLLRKYLKLMIILLFCYIFIVV